MSGGKYTMNIGIQYDQWMSDSEKTNLKGMAECISDQNKELNTKQEKLYSTLHLWTVRHLQNAVADGRVNRLDASKLYDKLTTMIVDTCMDTIPAPEE